MDPDDLELDSHSAGLLAEADEILAQAQAGVTGKALSALVDEAARVFYAIGPLDFSAEEIVGRISDAVAAMVAGAQTPDDLCELIHVPGLDRATVHRILDHPAYGDEILLELAEAVHDRFGHLLPFLDYPGSPRRLALLSPAVGVELTLAEPVLRRWAQLSERLQEVAEELAGTWDGPLGGFLDVAEATAA